MMANVAAWPKPTKAERAHQNKALCKDAALFALMMYVLTRIADGLPGLAAEDEALALRDAQTPLPFLYACIIVVTVTKGDLTGTPPPSKGEPKWDSVATPLGHWAFFTLQTLFVQTAYLCLKAYGIYMGNTKILQLCLQISLWTNTQGVALTILFFKLNWFEAKWIRDVKKPLEKKFPGISQIFLLGHVPPLILGIVDAWSTDPRLVSIYGSNLTTIIKIAFAYGTVYLCGAKFLQWQTGGTCIYPFIKDLDSVPKCIAFILAVGAAVSLFACGVQYLSLL